MNGNGNGNGHWYGFIPVKLLLQLILPPIVASTIMLVVGYSALTVRYDEMARTCNDRHQQVRQDIHEIRRHIYRPWWFPEDQPVPDNWEVSDEFAESE